MTEQPKPPVHLGEAIRTLDRAAKIMDYIESLDDDDYGSARTVRQGIESYKRNLISIDESGGD